MMTAQEIREITFEKSMRGYRVEDVQALLEELANQIETMTAEKEEQDKKIYVLAEKVAEYRKDENTLKTALINAQRLGEQVLQEAHQKAEKIVKDAVIKSENAEEELRNRINDEKLNLARVQAEVAEFKSNVLNLYKQHIDSLSTLPGEEEDTEENAEAAENADEAENSTTQTETASEGETVNSIFS